MRRQWYHCTNECYGPTMYVARKLPRYPAVDEPPVPRLCVSPCVAGCLAARLLNPNVHVYLSEPRRGIQPYGVWDKCVTGERWLIPPTELVHVGQLTLPRVLRPLVLRAKQGHRCTLRIRVATFIALERCLPEWSNSWSRRSVRMFQRLGYTEEPLYVAHHAADVP